MNDDNILPYRIKKGEVRSPNGRPKGAKSVKTILNEFLEIKKKVRMPFSLEEKRLTYKQIIIMRLIGKALDGDLNAIREIIDRIEGQSEQNLNLNEVVINVDGEKV